MEDIPSGPDPFAQFDSPAPAAPAPALAPPVAGQPPAGPDPFAEFDGPEAPIETGAVGAFMHHAERGLAPSLTGMAGAGMGSAVGTELGATAGFMVGGPLGAGAGGVVGAIGGGIAGFMGGAQAMSSAQDWLIKQMPESWQELLGQSEKQRSAEEEQQPIASQIGELAPFVLTMRPGIIGPRAPIPEGASTLRRAWSSPMTSHLLSAAMQGGTEAVSEVASGQKIDPSRIAIASAFGLLFDKPTPLGTRLTELGERPIRIITGRGEPAKAVPAAAAPEAAPIPERSSPTIAEAADAQVLGPGITESVFLGSVKQDPALRDAQQRAAQDEANVLTGPPAPDPVVTARQMEPDLFSHYDELQAQRADLVSRAAQATDAEATALQAHIAATDAEIRNITPQVSAAYRRAADVVQSPTIEPETTPEAPTVAENVIVGAPEGQIGAPLSRETLDAQQAAIIQEVTANLIAAGQAPDLAAANAQVWGHYYRTRAAKFKGALGSPMEVYQREAPDIRGVGAKADVGELAQRGQGDELLQGRQYPIAPRDEWYGEANYETSGGRLTYMTPDEFLARSRPLKMDETTRENVDDLKAHIESGKTLDPLKLFDGGKEDGRHRAIAAKELGIDRVPVIEFGDQIKGEQELFQQAPAVETPEFNQLVRRVQGCR
jgi:hypothetical protein